MNIELSKAVLEFFEVLEQTNLGYTTKEINHPVYLGCSLPYPARDNLNKILDNMKKLAGSTSTNDFYRGQLNVK